MPWRNRRICTAHSRRNGQPCQQPAMHDRTTCRLHGGHSLVGMACPSYRHGRYSKVLPARLARRYEEARTDKALLSLRDDIATAEARLADLFTRVDSGESGAVWQALRAALEACALAQTTGDVAAMQQHCTTMRELMTRGREDSAAWHEIYTVWGQRCKLVQTEAKRLLTMQQMVTSQELMTMMGVITHVIQQAVLAHADEKSGRKILAQISEEFRAISVREGEA